MNTFYKIFFAAAALVCAGCNVFKPSGQTNVFLDDEGNVLSVTYGQMKNDCKTVVKSPGKDGKEFETVSKLAVEVFLPKPENRRITMYKCMNFLPNGTMYCSSDTKWLYHTTGIACALYLINETGDDYLNVYSGILCERPSRDK